MIIRLKIEGFKNLADVEVRFGPFTCIAGANAVGKSNLFDAIQFLSSLTHKPLLDAAKSVRSEGQKGSDIRDIFQKVGNAYRDKMKFEVDMIIPKTGVDDLGQNANASITTVRYTLELALREQPQFGQTKIEIVAEKLEPITQSDAKESIKFLDKDAKPCKNWKESVISGRRPAPFISTATSEDGKTVIKFHQDGGSSGKPTTLSAALLPKTVLSSANAVENPTALIVKNEMQAWKMLQLEPSALRKSDELHVQTNAHIGENGSNLAATLYRLSQENQARDIYQEVATRISELVNGINEVDVEKDEKRELLTLFLKAKDGTQLPARSLSDGTLRFLGLTVLEKDTSSGGVICLEEPENGIHPQKITAMLRLLQDIATDVSYPVGEDNPLRQVIINTHSPLVVQEILDDTLLMAISTEGITENGQRYNQSQFIPMKDTWRTLPNDGANRTASLGELLAYLGNISGVQEKIMDAQREFSPQRKKRTVKESAENQLKFFEA